MVEIEVGVLATQCLDPRIDSYARPVADAALELHQDEETILDEENGLGTQRLCGSL
jgi:hypothetical protein